MAQCKQTAEEFVTNAFSPMVAVLCSQDAEKLCQKNNLSFVQLIQPFCRLSTEAHIRDPGGVPHTVKSLRIIVKDMQQSLYQPTMAKRLMNETVAAACPSNMDSIKGAVLTVGDYDLQISSTTPWFEVYRDCFLEVAYPSDHEFLKHFLSCMFIVSSSNPDPMDQFAKLSQQQHQQQHQSPTKPPKWFSPNTFKYYVLVHDLVEGEESKADAVYQSMKSMYGAASCHLLQINSRSVTSKDNLNNEPDPWSQFIPKSDSESLDMEASMFSKNDASFPSRVTEGEGTLRMENTLIEDATEVKEEPSMQRSASAPVMSHPLDGAGSADGGWSDTADNGQLQDATDGPQTETTAKSIPDQTLAKAGPIVNGGVTSSTQHGVCLTPSDHDRLKIFVHEFLVRGLIPWAERMIRTLNDQVSSRKRSLFSGAKKWFGGYKPNDKPTNNTTVVYTPEAPEMQTRRLADLAFMFQLYEIAYQTYHALKRDFNNDHAWLHHAGALEMASLAVFMQGNQTQRQYPAHYIEAAISTYLNTCKSPQFASRATLMSTEALKSRGMYAEAAMQFIKMTSEDSDMRSALMLEQAGHCFINMKQPMVRKYAFHMILAGHRFNKAGQRRHALRAYSQALQVYKGKDWILAEDHINFTVGRQSFNLKQLDNAASALRHLLCRSSQQTPAQQGAFLKEYLFVFKQHLQQGSSVDGLPQLPLPSVNGNTAKVLLCQPGQPPQGNRTPATSVGFEDDGRSLSWIELEEKVAARAAGKMPATFRPSVQCFSDLTNNNVNPVAVIGEPIYVEVTLVNPLKISLVLTDIVLLWSFLPHVDEEQNQEKPPQQITNEHVETGKKSLASELVESEVIQEMVLEALMTEPLQLSVIPKKEGEVHITGIAYNLGTSSSNSNSNSNSSTSTVSSTIGGSLGSEKPSFISGISVRGKQIIEVQGPRLNTSKVEKCSKIYGPDRRLDVQIVPKMPLLEVNFYGFPQTLMCGEVQQLTVEFTNRGPLPLHNLYLACSHPKFCTFGSSDTLPDASAVYQHNTQQDGASTQSNIHIAKDLQVEEVQRVPLKCDKLDPQGTVSVPLWIRGLDINGVHNVDFLFYYEPVDSACALMRHRVVRHTAVMRTSNALKLIATAQKLPPSKKGQMNSLVLALEAEKIFDASVIEVNLLQVTSVSPYWTLHHLSTRPHTDMTLSATESLLMSFKATRCQDCAAESSPKLVFSDVTFDQYQISSTGSPCCDFCFKSRQALKLTPSGTGRTENNLPLDLGAPSQPSRDAGLEDILHVDLSLVVLWKFKVVTESGSYGTIQGQHHLHIDSIDTPVCSPLVSKVPVEHAPVKIIKDRTPSLPRPPNPELVCQILKICLRHSVTIQHNFHKNRLCYLPVNVILHNTSQNLVKVDMYSREHSLHHRSHSESANSDVILEPTSSGFSWSGKIHSTLQVQPQETQQLHLVACFNSPGVYNLNRLQVAAGVIREDSDLDIDMVMQKHAVPSVVTVKQEPVVPS